MAHPQTPLAQATADGRLGDLLDLAEDGVFGLAADGRIEVVNSTLARMLGYDSPNELVSLVSGLGDLCIDETAPEALLAQLQTHGQVRRFEVQLRRRDGAGVWASVNARGIGRPDGALAGVEGMVSDITERRRTQHELRASEEMFRQLADTINEVFFLVNGDFTETLYVNPAYERIFGRSRQSAYANPRSWLDAVHPRDRDRAIEVLEAGLLEQVEYEYRIVRDDGDVRWVGASVTPHRGPDGKVDRIAGVAWDTTERKRAELRVGTQYAVSRVLAGSRTLAAAARGLLEALCRGLEFPAGALWELDDKARELRCLEVWHRRSWEAPRLDAIPKDLRLRTASEVGVAARAWRRAAPIWSRSLDRESEICAAALGDGFKSAWGFPIRRGEQVLGVVELFSGDRDDPDEVLGQTMEAFASQIGQFIEREWAVRELRESYARLREVDAERRELFARVLRIQEEERRRVAAEIHDGVTQLLVSALYWLRTSADDAVDDRAGSLGRGVELVEEALQEARNAIQNLRPELLDDLGLGPSLRALTMRDQNGVEFELDVDDAVGLAPHQETALYRIAQEALTNIRKHAHASRVQLALTEDGDEVLLRVKDDGVGFDGAEARGRPGGTSFGLKGMAERATLVGGRLKVASKPGKGTTLTLRLPKAEAAS